MSGSFVNARPLRTYMSVEGNGYSELDSGQTMYEIEDHDPELPGLPREYINFEAARADFRNHKGVLGAKGGSGPSVKVPPTNAYESAQLDGDVETAGVLDSAAKPKGWLTTYLWPALGEQVLGSAPGTSPLGPTAGQSDTDYRKARVNGGAATAEIVSVATTGSPAKVWQISVDRSGYAAGSERFSKGSVVILENADGDLFPVLITDIDVSGGNDVLTVLNGPASASFSAASGKIYGTFSCGLPRRAANDSVAMVRTWGEGDAAREFAWFQGVNGGLSFEAAAKQIAYLTLATETDRHAVDLLNGHTIETFVDNATLWLNNPRIDVALDRWIHLGSEWGPVAPIDCSRVQAMQNAERGEVMDINGRQGRCGRPLTGQKPRVTLESLWSRTKEGHFSNGDAVSVSVCIGTKSAGGDYGVFGFVMVQGRVAEAINPQDRSGIVGTSLVIDALRPDEEGTDNLGADAADARNFSDLYFFWG